ncbi:hypothetical protein [Phormidesmis priestleyi]|uniref:hypothetical protein n=1 Tax=Phormidesmis priestleyi TaxID=268141 RepID=UPI0009330A89|nr:hypothetical protein [Phormidesmis priestleyi]
MVTTVVTINLLLALGCFYIAWKVWQFRRAIATAADALLIAEQHTHAVLHGAPDAILRGQIGTHQLRQSYQKLEPQYQQVRRALALLSLGQTVWRRRAQFLPLPKMSQRTFRTSKNKPRK